LEAEVTTADKITAIITNVSQRLFTANTIVGETLVSGDWQINLKNGKWKNNGTEGFFEDMVETKTGQRPLDWLRSNSFLDSLNSNEYLVFTETIADAPTTRRPFQPYATYIRACDIQPENVDWLCKNYLALGNVHILGGQPGIGKSQVAISWVAALTNGLPWPDGTPNYVGPMNVIMLTAEDSPRTAIIPRLQAAGANINRVFIFDDVIREDRRHHKFLLTQDLERLRGLKKEIEDKHGAVGLITIDPITSYMGGGENDSHRVTDVRNMLDPLNKIAEDERVAILMITHPSKTVNGGAINQYTGSVAFAAAPRLGFVCIPEIEEDEDSGDRSATGRVLFSCVKTNIGKIPNTLVYEIDSREVGVDHRDGKSIYAPYVLWRGTADVSADEAVAMTAPRRGRPRVARDEDGASESQRPVVEWLKAFLAEGGKPQTEIEAAGHVLGFSIDQMKRAKKLAGVRSKRYEGVWFWALIPF
jgi:putative DNA primase/helicase